MGLPFRLTEVRVSAAEAPHAKLELHGAPCGGQVRRTPDIAAMHPGTGRLAGGTPGTSALQVNHEDNVRNTAARPPLHATARKEVQRFHAQGVFALLAACCVSLCLRGGPHEVRESHQ